ncbi:MAG TPA: STT3 domain-containing protein [Candidatus Nanoarchaeia archaeon]|nr:STT3 domain-containing protein [Candidatus Nanoarchaeia archaeon]
MDPKDDDISIDFGKIKEWFSKKAGEKKGEGSEEKKHDAVPSSDKIDFSSVKKGAKDAISALPAFFSKYGIYLLVLIPIILAIFLRIQPAYLPMTDEWSQNVVFESYKDQIATQVRQQYPNLPDQNINSLVDRQFESYLASNKEQIVKDVESTSEYFKSQFQDDNGDTYLIAIDPYFWLRHTRNVLNNGHPGDALKDGEPYDTYMNAPIGRFVPADMFHAYITAYLYKLFSLFSAIPLPRVAFFMPVFISALAVIPAFFIVRRLAGNFGGLIAGIVVAIHPAFLVRTMGGISDTDGYNVLFPLLITWVFLESMETQSLRSRVLLTLLNGFFVGIYAFAWSGWWYIFDFLLAVIVIYTIYYALIHRVKLKVLASQQTVKNAITIFVLLFVFSGIFVTMFTNWDIFYKATLARPIGFTKIKDVGITTVWPNVFTTVAEQTPASLNSVIDQTGIGSFFLFFISLMGMILPLVHRKEEGKMHWGYAAASGVWYILVLAIRPQNLILFLGLISIPILILFFHSILKKEDLDEIKLAILLIIWYVSTIYASTKGVRFTLLIVPAFSLAIGIAFGISSDFFSRLAREFLKIDKYVAKFSVILVLLALLVYPVNVVSSSYNSARSQVTDMNDGWYNSLSKIDKEASRNTIITSWWDYGHWFKYIANRPVTFDGTSQNSPPAHWVGYILSTSNEEEAVGLLRMLDCGANTAYDKIIETVKDAPKTIGIIHHIATLGREEAGKFLTENGLTKEQSEEVLKYTHCEPPEAYFVASDDMIGKAGVWAHFGNWNFDRALMYNTLNRPEYKKDFTKGTEFLKEHFSMTEQEASNAAYEVQNLKTSEDANNWIAPWPSFRSGARGCSKLSEKEIDCDFQGIKFTINLETLQADIETGQGTKHPSAVWLATKDGMRERRFNDTIGISFVVYPDGNTYRSIAVDPQIAGGMFTRMFFLSGHSLRHFKPFSFATTVTGGRVYIYKVDWEGSDMNLLDAFKEAEVNATAS